MVEFRQALIGYFSVTAPRTETQLLLSVAGVGDDLRVVMEGVSGGQSYSIDKRVQLDLAAWDSLAQSLDGQDSFELELEFRIGQQQTQRTARYRVTRSLAAPGSLLIQSDQGVQITAIEYRCNPFWLVALVVAVVSIVAVSTVAVTAMLTCSDVDMKAGGASASVRCGNKFTEAAEPIPYFPDETPDGVPGD